MKESLQATVLLVEFSKLILLILCDFSWCHEFFGAEQRFIICQVYQLHLVSDPVVEEIENKGPDGFELVRVVLVVVS
jgi:hypothetical protein